jgi:hypothetical protein
MKQWVQLKPGQNYLLKFDVRPKVAGASLSVPICEEWMLTSYSCVTQTFEFGGSYGKWRTVEKRFSAAELSADQGNIRRPFKLALYYPTPKSSIDVDNISLVSDNGVNLIGNGDFAVGLDRWFFSADSHLQWHVKSLFYGVLFDQGWFGLMALCLFLMLALYRAVQKCLQGDPTAVAPLAALSSFLVAGLFDTLIDAPRFFMLLLLLAWACSRGGRPLRQVPSRQKPTNEKKFSLPGS